MMNDELKTRRPSFLPCACGMMNDGRLKMKRPFFVFVRYSSFIVSSKGRTAMMIKELSAAFLFGFGVGVIAAAMVGARIATEIQKAKEELTSLLERVAHAIETR
jgi:hypothetical protein